MRNWLLFVVVVLTAWIQVSWFGHLRPLGVMPNLMLVLVVLCALWRNATPTLAAAVGGGWLLDIAAGDGNFGLRMAFYVVVALAIIAGRQLGLHGDSAVSGLGLVLIGTLIYNLVILATIGQGIGAEALGRVGRELVDNLVLTALIYLVRADLGRRPRASLELGARLGQ